jgi:NADPH:quinone reductase-like Zn-dependent oxidoreductase
MRVWAIEEAFGIENLRMIERPEPSPGPGEVLVRVRACSLNFRDLLMVRGIYNPRQPLPLVPLSDGAGEVVAIGDSVTRVKPGDRVAATFVQDWIAGRIAKALQRTTLGGPLDGMLAELKVLPAHGLVRVPDHLTFAEAATLPCAALTAWTALVEEGNTRPGDTVLILGTGGVSIFALQFAKVLGARAIVTSSSDEKLARAKALGAAEVINYRKDAAWGKAARDLSGGEGVDLVVEVGGAATLDQSLAAVRPGGTIALIGNLGGATADVNLLSIFMRGVRVQGILVGHRAGFEAMNRAVAAHGIRPVIDRAFPFDEAPAAFAHLATGDHFGKVVVETATP